MASKEAKDIAASPVKDIMAMSEAYKMTKAQFLMSQIDLDPIESQHSQDEAPQAGTKDVASHQSCRGDRQVRRAGFIPLALRGGTGPARSA